MPFISVTNTFSNGSKIKSSDINTNFSDMLNGITDGTKDLRIFDASLDSMTVDRITAQAAASLKTLSTADASFSGKVETEKLTAKKMSLYTTPVNYVLDGVQTIAPSKTSISVSANQFSFSDTNAVTVDASNNKFEITENGETVPETITIANGSYTGVNMATEIQTKMNATLTQTYAVTYSGGALGTYTISCPGKSFTLWVTGGKELITPFLPYIGFYLGGVAGLNTTSDSHTSDEAKSLLYYRKLAVIDVSSLIDGTILDVRLGDPAVSGNYSSVVIDTDLLGLSSDSVTDIALTKYSKLWLKVVKNASVGTVNRTVCVGFSSNFLYV